MALTETHDYDDIINLPHHQLSLIHISEPTRRS